MPVTYINVLVISDDDAASRRLTRPFAAWGWGVVRATADPADALARLREEPIDLVLLSLDAAERDDYAFLNAWRAEPALYRVPVVVTARRHAALGRLARCVEHGASDYITHPHQPTLLRARLQNVLQRKLLQEQAAMALGAFGEIEKIADDLRLVILPLGAALSAEADYERLIARVVAEAQTICNADAGVLYLADDLGRLHYTYVRVQSLGFTYAEPTGGRAAAANGEPPGSLPEFAPIPLTDPADGAPNSASLPVHVALTGESVNLTDIHSGRFDLSRLLRFEARFQPYQAQSCLIVPLHSGQINGALLLINSQNPLSGEIVPFDGYHQQVAEALASLAAIVLSNRLLNERQADLLRYKRELEIGRAIQLSFLPARLPTPPGWELVADFQPALEVAGDFYDAFALPHGHVALVIADVVGKGVTAALFMAIVRSLFRALFQQNYFPNKPVAGDVAEAMTPFSFVDRGALLNAVRLTNAYLIGNHGDTYAFATLWAAVLDPASGRLLYVNAGHNPPLLLARLRDGRRLLREELSPTGPAIGLLPNAGYWLAETRLAADDLLFAYTDGATDARDAAGQEMGRARLQALLADAATAADALGTVEAALRAHSGEAEAFDDVTLLALRRMKDEG